MKAPSTMKRALVVDNCVMARSAMLVMLQRNGWEAIGAADGADALALAGAWRLDLVITAPRLRKVSGLRFVRGLKTDPELSAVRVVLLVKHAQRPGPAGALADGVLVKDSQIEKQLQEQLRSVFDSNPAPRKRELIRTTSARRRLSRAGTRLRLASGTSY